MLDRLTLPMAPGELAALAGYSVLTFFSCLFIGRLLKRRFGVRLGFLYQILCIAVAIYVPLVFAGMDWRWRGLSLRRDLLGLLVILGAVFLVAVLDRFFWLPLARRRGPAASVPKFVRDIVAIALISGSLGLVLGLVYGKTVPGLLAGSGIVAIIIGLALQDLLGNIFSGISLQIGRPFRPGDWLRVDGEYVRVIDVNWRSVRVITNDEVMLDIPNNEIARNTIINLNAPMPRHAMRLAVGVDYSSPPNQVKEVLVAAVKGAPGVLVEPAPRAMLRSFGDSAIEYELKFYMVDHALFLSACDAIRTNIWYAFKRSGIKIPFPIHTIQIERPAKPDNMEERAFAALRNFPLMAALDDSQVRYLVRSARLGNFGRQESIIEQGDAGESMFVMLDGRASVMVRVDGKGAARVATLNTGDCFGEMSLLTGEPRAATVVAATDCEVLEIGKGAISRLLRENPRLASQLGELLAQRLEQNEERVSNHPFPQQPIPRTGTYADTLLRRLNFYFGL